MQCCLGQPPNLLSVLVPCSLFLIPAHVPTSLEKIMRNFFWEGFAGGKINHLVKWSLVSLPSKDGGLGLGGIKTQNSALFAKWG